MRLSFVAVVSDQQFRDLVIVRNECREGLTHDTHELTLQDQKVFRERCWRENTLSEFQHHYEPYLLYDEQWPIGYGLLKWDGERYWMTIGLVGEYRGRKLSRLLINYITEMGHREGAEVWLDVDPENKIAYNGYLKAGYVVEESAPKHDKILVVMKHIRAII